MWAVTSILKKSTEEMFCRSNRRLNNLFKPAGLELLIGRRKSRSYHSDSWRHSSTVARSSPIKMSYNIIGEDSNCIGPPVVIMHGLLGSKKNWSALSKALNNSTKRKIIAVDARNHGDSPHTDDFSYDLMSQDIIHLLDTSAIDKACLIGHSMGGRTMMKVALAYPERVEKLIVVDISPIQFGVSVLIEKYLRYMEQIDLDNNLPLSQGRRVADKFLYNHVPELDIRQFLLSNLTKVDDKFEWKANIRSLFDNFKNVAEFNLTNEIYPNSVLFIGGKQSDYLKPDDHDKIRLYFPLAQFKYLDTGHWVHVEQPGAFLQLATDFIKSSSV